MYESPNSCMHSLQQDKACFNDGFFSHYQVYWLCNHWWIVIFGITHGVVIQLNVSNSSTNGTKNITINTKITIPIIIAIFLFIILLTLKMEQILFMISMTNSEKSIFIDMNQDCPIGVNWIIKQKDCKL